MIPHPSPQVSKATPAPGKKKGAKGGKGTKLSLDAFLGVPAQQPSPWLQEQQQQQLQQQQQYRQDRLAREGGDLMPNPIGLSAHPQTREMHIPALYDLQNPYGAHGPPMGQYTGLPTYNTAAEAGYMGAYGGNSSIYPGGGHYGAPLGSSWAASGGAAALGAGLLPPAPPPRMSEFPILEHPDDAAALWMGAGGGSSLQQQQQDDDGFDDRDALRFEALQKMKIGK